MSTAKRIEIFSFVSIFTVILKKNFSNVFSHIKTENAARMVMVSRI